MPKRRKPHPRASSPPEAAAGQAPTAVYAPVLKTGFQATTSRVQEMHHAIAGKTFDALQQVPGFSVPTRLVQGVHDAITHGVYAAVRHGGGAMFSLAGQAERMAADPARSPQGKELTLRSALNAAVGDALLEAGSSLAVKMSLHADGEPLALTRERLVALRERVCVFIHGLACDEHSWSRPNDAWAASQWAGQGDTYAALLEAELGIGAVFVRYNSGLSVEENGRQLAAQLDELMQAAPSHLRELVLVGHSMGGLVALSACEQAAADALSWASLARMVICLGTPHQGAPLERLGHLASMALGLSSVTQPLGRIANTRSQGIKDLRHGRRGKTAGRAGTQRVELALRFVAGSLADPSHGMAGAMIDSVLGDGLVTRGSASDDGLVGDVQRVEVAGLGHMVLLNHPRVYALIRGWLGAPDAT